MKRFIPALMLMVGSFALLVGVVFAQTVPTVSKTATYSWTAPTTNEDGTPLIDLAGYVIAVSANGTDLRTGGTPLASQAVTDPAAVEVSATQLFASLPAGSYRAWVRAYDVAGNQGQWGEPFAFNLDPVSPGVPTGLKVVVKVEVTVTTP